MEQVGPEGKRTLLHHFCDLHPADLPNYGLTQPCWYHGDESMYARAILAAEKRVNGRSVTHNLLHMDSVALSVPPRITHLDAEAGDAVVSVWAATGDYIWGTHEGNPDVAQMAPEKLADRFVTEDGKAGRLAELMEGDGPLVLITHWQSLYSNGSWLGFRTYQEVVRRLHALWDRQIVWCKLSELSEQFLVAQTARFTVEANRARVRIVVTAPFDADVLTFSLPMPWPLLDGPTVLCSDGKAMEAVQKPWDLRPGTFLMRGSTITVSLRIPRNVPQEVVILPNNDPWLSTN